MHRVAVLLLAALTAGAGCRREPAAQIYQLQGQVLAVKADTNEILVRHEDIPGFMPAMTMPYVVKDAAILTDRGPVSFDPKNDQPAVLRAHAATLGADPAVWRFATADTAVVDRLAATFGVNVIRERDGTITHNLRTAVIDPRWRIVAIHDSNDWTAATIADELTAALHAR